MVLRRGEGQRTVPVAERKERGFLALEEILHDHLRAGRPEGAPENHVDGGFGFRNRGGDDDALAGGKAIRLDDDGRAAAADIGPGRIGRSETLVVGGRNREFAAQVLGEALRALKLGGSFRRTESRNPAGLKIVDETGDEGHFRPDDHEVHLHEPAEIGHSPVVGHIEGHVARELRSARVARGDEEACQLRAARQGQSQRMFAPAGTDEKYVHMGRLLVGGGVAAGAGAGKRRNSSRQSALVTHLKAHC